MKIGGIVFAAWQYIWLFPLVIVAGAIIFYYVCWQYKAVRTLATHKWMSTLVKHYSLTCSISKAVLWICAVAFLFIALLRPQWNEKEQIVVQHGRDLLIALDISRSMLACDVKPNRLTYAKEKINTLLRYLQSERVGLILFSGSAFVQCPLTSDYTAFHLFLDHVDVETIASGTTALDQAVKQALDVFSRVTDRKHKLLVILTDGEDFSSNLASIKQEAMQQGMIIFTIGLGTPEGAPIPLCDAQGIQIGHQKDARGSVVISRLNEEMLQALAEESGGTYLRATSDDKDVATLSSLVQKVEKEKIEEKSVSIMEEQYMWFALASFILLIVEWLL